MYCLFELTKNNCFWDYLPELLPHLGLLGGNKIRGLHLAQFLGAEAGDEERAAVGRHLQALISYLENLSGCGLGRFAEECGVGKFHLLPPKRGGGPGLGVAAPAEVNALL